MGAGAYAFILYRDFTVLVFVFMGAVATLIGGKFLALEYGQEKFRKIAIANGKKIRGEIIDYADDTSLIINGVPVAFIVVKFEKDGKEEIGKFRTGSTDPGQWPIGLRVDLYEYEGDIVWDKN